MMTLCSLWAMADNISVSGVVTDQKGETLIGATVQLKDAAVGTTTDIDGKFTIVVPEESTLVFAYMGYNTIEQKASAQMKVQMQESVQALQEVVAIGYGTMKRSDITGSMVSVTADDMQQTSSATMDQMLQGRAAGVEVNLNSGAAGAGSSVQLRGINSLNSTNEPIYVIDGAIVQSSSGSDVYSNPLADLNPNDVESIEILKDASATAIYGSQAANGVIIVNMKKGKEGAPKINIKASAGLDQLPKYLDVMNLSEFAHWAYDAKKLEGKEIERFKDWESLGEGTDWQREIFRLGVRQDYNVSIRGGKNNTTYSISAGYYNQRGIIINNDFQRFNIRGNIEIKPYKWMETGLTFSLNQTDRNTGMASWGVVAAALQGLPNFAVRNEDGSWGKSGYDSETAVYQPNPVAKASITERKNMIFSTRENFHLTFKPTQWLSWRNEVTFDYNMDNYRYLEPAYDLGGTIKTYATHETSKTMNRYISFKSVLNGNWTIGTGHHLTAMLGYEANERYIDYLYGYRTGGSNTSLALSSGDATNDANEGYVTVKRFMSVFGRLTYNYKERYMLTATVRGDGSSLFRKGQRWGVFPSVAGAWSISKEPWYKPAQKVMNGLKLRVGYGIVGNANLADNTYLPTFTNLESNFGLSYRTYNMPNYEGLTWEKTDSWNVGVDMQFLKNRIEVIVDLYNKNTRDLLLQTALPSYTGTSLTGAAQPMWANVGSMNNRGLEVTFNAHVLSQTVVKWKTTVTATATRNRITALNTDAGFIDRTLDFDGIGETVTRTAVGHSVSEFYGYEVAGRINSAEDYLRDNGDGTSTVIAATPNYAVGTVVSNTASLKTSVGDLLFKDNNGDGIIDEADRNYIGSPLPKVSLGWNNTFSYKGVSLSIFLYSAIGGKVFNFNRRMMDEPSPLNSTMTNKFKRVAGYAHIGYRDGDATNTNIWNQYVMDGADPTETRIDADKGNQNYRVSDRYVEDGSYLRIKNIALSWSLPKEWIKKAKFQSLKLTCNVQNAWTFTRYTGYDPEIGAQNGQYSFSGQGMLLYGVDTGKVPAPRTYLLSIDATF